MARFTDDTINRIKQDISLLRIVEAQGNQTHKQGKDYAICCPFHEDKSPSCIISPASNLFNCFGCGAGGSVIDWVMKTQGVSFRHAVELLKSDLSSLAADSSRLIKVATVPKLEAPVSENAEDQAALKQVMDYYHQTLLQESDAQAYLVKRGLDDAELIKHFQLGYANRTLGLRLPQKNRKAGAAMREQLQRIGLYRDTGREHFAGSLVIPVADENGIIGEVYGRKLLDNLRKGTPKHTYLPGPHCAVLNIQSLRHVEEVILCESLIDALTFWRWGFRHVTSSYGTNGFTDEILEALTGNKVKRVLIAYDRDESGNKAALEVADKLNQHGIDCFRVLFPKGMDANSYACQTVPSQKALALVIRKAEWMGKGKAPERQLDLATEEPSFTCDVAQPLSSAASLAIPVTPEKTAAKKEKGSVPDNSKPPINTALNDQSEKTLIQSATPIPSPPLSDVDVKQTEQELLITIGERLYRVRGLENNTSYDQLKIQLLARLNDAIADQDAIHMDKLDLTSSKQRQVFINQASKELGVSVDVIKKDLGKLLLVLEDKQAESQKAAELPKSKLTELSSKEREAALDLLRSPDLLKRILSDFNQAGVVGEETNKLTGYLACVSRKLDRPLAVLVQSSSAAGKSSLMDAILTFMPVGERVQYSAMTGQSLFYMGETQLKHKILAISEEEGASNASYALKLLQSEGEVTMASTGKDESTGNLVTKEYTVEGPVMLFLTTTAIDIDEELLNRCMILTVNESREQTQAIHAAQRAKRTLQGLQNKLEKDRITQVHRNAQQLLKPLKIINPYADQLTFLNDKTRTRRDHEKYLTLIDSIALLHQYQREVKTISHDGDVLEYIEVTLSDIETANQLAHEILGRTLDELPPQTRKLLKEIQVMVQKECQAQCLNQSHYRFSRKIIRDFTHWGNTQLKVHLGRLEDMEYLLIHRGGRGQSFEYELLYDNQKDSQSHLMGLLDIEILKKQTYDKKKSGANGDRSESGRPQVGGVSGLLKSTQANEDKALLKTGRVEPENIEIEKNNGQSYHHVNHSNTSSLAASSVSPAACVEV